MGMIQMGITWTWDDGLADWHNWKRSNTFRAIRIGY
jgi:hypothetical protein